MAVQFEPVWNYPPGDTSFSYRPEAPVLPRRYPDEPAAEAALERFLSPYCHLYRQVRLTQKGYPHQKIDYVAVFKDADAQSSLRLVGIEVKRGFDRLAEACAVAQQAMRYRQSRVTDPRLALMPFLDTQLPYVLIWPPLDWCDDTSWCNGRPDAEVIRARYVGEKRGEARGIYQLLQHWNVGHIEVRPWWSYQDQEWRPGIVMMNGQQQVWTSRYIDQISDGFRGGAKLASNPKRGMRYLG